MDSRVVWNEGLFHPVGDFIFSDPVSWVSLPTVLPTYPLSLLPHLCGTQGISPGSTCTFHNRLIQLNITPAESWVTYTVDPPLILFFPILPPTPQYAQLKNTRLTLISLIHALPCSPDSLSWHRLCCRNPQGHRCATSLRPHKEEQHVCSVLAEGAIGFFIPHLSTNRLR